MVVGVGVVLVVVIFLEVSFDRREPFLNEGVLQHLQIDIIDLCDVVGRFVDVDVALAGQVRAVFEETSDETLRIWSQRLVALVPQPEIRQALLRLHFLEHFHAFVVRRHT